MIVWIASYPRSGNRLTRATLRSTFGVPWVGSAASEESIRKDLGDLLDQLGVEKGDDPLPVLREFDQPVYLKTHSQPEYIHWLPERARGVLQRAEIEDPPEEGEPSPAIYLVRDGRDCLVSFAHYLKVVSNRPRYADMDREEAIADLMRRERPYGGWSGNVGAWRRRTAQTEIVRFEDLIADPEATIRGAASAIGVELNGTGEDPPSFKELRRRSLRPELLRRGEAEAWRSEFPPQLLEEFWSLHGAEMEALGYPRD